jgi:hypothetical protein
MDFTRDADWRRALAERHQTGLAVVDGVVLKHRPAVARVPPQFGNEGVLVAYVRVRLVVRRGRVRGRHRRNGIFLLLLVHRVPLIARGLLLRGFRIVATRDALSVRIGGGDGTAARDRTCSSNSESSAVTYTREEKMRLRERRLRVKRARAH